MFEKKSILEFNRIFPKYISDEFLFSLDTYRLFLEGLSINPVCFLNEWCSNNRESIIAKHWKQNTQTDWKWSLSFPLFSLLEQYIENIEYPIIIGLSGLPGSGKSSLGSWINCVAIDLGIDIKVIS